MAKTFELVFVLLILNHASKKHRDELLDFIRHLAEDRVIATEKYPSVPL